MSWGRDRSLSRLDELFEFAPGAAASDEDLVFWFVQVIRWARGGRNASGASARLRFLRAQLAQHPSWKTGFSGAISELLRRWDVDHLLAYGGIPRDFHFGGALREWLSSKGLPAACKTEDAAEVLSLGFREDDIQWLEKKEVGALAREVLDPILLEPLEHALREALVELGSQIVAQAHSPAIRRLSKAERSPFRGLSQALNVYAAETTSPRSADGIRGRIAQCKLLVEGHRAELVGRGADLNTTFQLVRLRQQLDRLALVASLMAERTDWDIGAAFSAIVESVTRGRNGTRLLRGSSDLVLRNLIETTATVGRAYLDQDRSSWRAAFEAGAGGGALMVFATLVKYSLASLSLTPFYEGIAFSANYAIIFCAAYLLHFTIATKLPAHTAAALANTVCGPRGHRRRLAAFLSVWSATVRLQIAGLLGNLAGAVPLAFLLDFAWTRLLGHHVLNDERAMHAFSSNSLAGPSVLYAALTGLLLWLSSLIGAAGDNWVRLTRLVDRLATNLPVMRTIGPLRARPLAERIAARVGGLLGNASLGVMLGAIPAGFAITGLPIEIRHVTVSASSVSLAIAARGDGAPGILLALLGVVAIAAVNVSVSFALALWLALLATTPGSRPGSAYALVRVAFGLWLRLPRRASSRRVRALRKADPASLLLPSTRTSPP
jgi:site-specific recombinase